MESFCSNVQKFHWLFWLEVLAKSTFQDRICSASQEKENKILRKANEEMGAQLQLTLDSLKSEERQGNY